MASSAQAPIAEPGRDPARNLLEQELAALYRDREQLHNELFEAAQVQRKLTGPRKVRREGVEIATEVFPAGYLSGDFFSIFDANERTAFAVGDIAGKGIAAGLWFTHLVSLIRILASRQSLPALAIAAINHELCQSRPGPPITSMFLGMIDGRVGELAFCNAGHPAPLLLHAQGDMTALGEGGPVLGAVPTASFETGRTLLAPGDTLLVYSDGLVECCNSTGEEFGAERLVRESRRAAPKSASEILFSVLGAVQDFAGNQTRQDDITLMVIQREDGPSGSD